DLSVDALVRKPLSVVCQGLSFDRSAQLIQPVTVVGPRLRLRPGALVGEPDDMCRPGRAFDRATLSVQLGTALTGKALLLLALRLLEHQGEFVRLASTTFLL